MKIEITNEGEFYHIYKVQTNRPLKNYRANLSPFNFYEDDIIKLLNDKQYDKFLKGEYTFLVDGNFLKLITGERSAQTRNELLLYP